MDGALFAFAMSLVSQQTVLPVFVTSIGGSNISVGLIPVLWTFGFNFPQILIASHAQRAAFKKPLLLKTAIGQRIPWLLMGLLCFTVVGRVSGDGALMLFFVAYALAAVGGSMNLPVWFDLVAKITSVHLRGRLFALRSISGAGLGILGGGIVTYTLASVGFPHNFGVLFILAFCMMMLSYLFLLSLREGADGGGTAQGSPRSILHGVPAILRSNRNFRNYLISDALLTGSTMAGAFFAVYAIRKFSLTDAYAGPFTIAMMAGMITGTLLFGFLADRYGHKLNLLVAGLSTVLACVLALTAADVYVYLVVFVCSAWSVGLTGISRLPLIAELCREMDRPAYIALANLVTSPFVLLGIAAGWVADEIGYEPVFVSAAVLALGAAVWLGLAVEEPRFMRLSLQKEKA